jgi:hypothetical protein
VHHNLYAHQKGRLPRVGSEVGTGAYNDFRNNIFYNWFGTGGSGSGGQPSFNNFVGNFWRAGNGGDDVTQTPGPDGVRGNLDDVGVVNQSAGGTGIFSGSNSTGTRVHHGGNLKDINKDADAGDGVALANGDFGSSSFQSNALWSGGAATYNGVTESATDAYDRVLDYMGANWWNRDAVDQRLVSEVRTGTGKIRAWADDPFNPDPNEGTEWRTLLALRANPATGAAPFTRPAGWDVDGDGMPGAWEAAHGLNPAVADNNGDLDGDGYTNLEEYVNEVAAWPAPAPIVFGGATNTRYAQITNWDANADPAFVHNWQPSRYDVAEIRSGAAFVDAVGQHAGTLRVAPTAGIQATLDVTAGWLEVAGGLEVGFGGAGTVNHTGGTVAAAMVKLGGGAVGAGFYNLSDNGVLRVGVLDKDPNEGGFSFTGGMLSADEVTFDLVNNGGVISPGAALGTTHVMGDLTMTSGSILLELAGASAGQFDRVAVDGLLTAGGTFKVDLVNGYAPSAGASYDLFDFGSASGAFTLDLPALAAGLSWNTSNLLTTGALSVAATNADFDADGDVDADDLHRWMSGYGTASATHSSGDANGDGAVDGGDLMVWQRQLGATPVPAAAAFVPEPPNAAVGLVALAWFALGGRMTPLVPLPSKGTA